MGSAGEATPPDAVILIQWAPRRSCSRVARMHSSTPSNTRAFVNKTAEDRCSDIRQGEINSRTHRRYLRTDTDIGGNARAVRIDLGRRLEARIRDRGTKRKPRQRIL